MGFATIGPFDLRRSDLVAASVVISLLIGSRWVRVWCWLFLGLPLLASAVAVANGDLVVAGGFALAVLFIFILAPAMRSLKRGKNIVVEYSPEGVVTETADARATYKWATIWSARKVGSRLFVMITPACALVIPDRSTSGENMGLLMRTISDQIALKGGS